MSCHQTSIHAAPFDPAPLSRPDIPFIPARSFDHRTLSSIRRRADCRRQNVHSFRFPSRRLLVSSRSVHCLPSDSNYKYLSPALANARQLWPPPFLSFLLCVPGNCGPSPSLSRLSLTSSLRPRPRQRTPARGSEDNNSRTPHPVYSRRVLVMGAPLGFHLLSSLSNSRADVPSAIYHLQQRRRFLAQWLHRRGAP